MSDLDLNAIMDALGIADSKRRWWAIGWLDAHQNAEDRVPPLTAPDLEAYREGFARGVGRDQPDPKLVDEFDDAQEPHVSCARLDGWLRIGKYCSADRRSLWARKVVNRHGVHAVELAAGREGRDAFVRVVEGDRLYAAVLQVVETAVFAATT